MEEKINEFDDPIFLHIAFLSNDFSLKLHDSQTLILPSHSSDSGTTPSYFLSCLCLYFSSIVYLPFLQS